MLRVAFRAEIDFFQQVISSGAWTTSAFEPILPVAPLTGLSKSSGSIECLEQIFSTSLSVWCGMPSLTKNSRHVGGGGANVHGPSVR